MRAAAQLLAGLALAACAGNQPPPVATAPPPAGPLAVGTVAPDFVLASATPAGVGKPVRMKDLRGKVVVIAFFYQARTKG